MPRDPISDEERRIVADLRDEFEKKYGKPKKHRLRFLWVGLLLVAVCLVEALWTKWLLEGIL